MSLMFPSSSPLIGERRLPEDRRELSVIGWRSWRLQQTADGVVLHSLFGSERWEIGITHAKCRHCPPWLPKAHHLVPAVSCQCGLYAFSTPREAMWHAERRMGTIYAGCRQPAPVAGAIVAWGRVVQHDDRVGAHSTLAPSPCSTGASPCSRKPPSATACRSCAHGACTCCPWSTVTPWPSLIPVGPAA